jgi:cytochrome c-type biogenesis protein CcmH
MIRNLIFVVLVAMVLPGLGHAVQPNEVLSDPAMEARARAISKNLRCLVCRNENIDDSNAGLARDLRVMVRERLQAGDSDEQVVAFVVSRYGEYVLLKPRFTGSNLLLWAAGPIMLLLGGGLGWQVIRRRKEGDAPEGLNADEAQRLKELLEE